MTPEQQRIAIAEASGWEFHPLTEHLYSQDEKAEAIMCWVRPGNDLMYTECVPNYPKDLNAMHEAEKKLTDEQWDVYSSLLLDACGGSPNLADRQRDPIHATAAQRAEAFIETLNLWKP